MVFILRTTIVTARGLGVIDGFTKREVAIFVALMIVDAVLTVVATNYLIGMIEPRDPSDPLTKASGLKPEQAIKPK